MENKATSPTTTDDLAVLIREHLKSNDLATTAPWCGDGSAAFTVKLPDGRTVRVTVDEDKTAGR